MITNQDNIMQSMLAKGDELKPRYSNFDYNQLDPAQLKWIHRLTWFSKYR